MNAHTWTRMLLAAAAIVIALHSLPASAQTSIPPETWHNSHYDTIQIAYPMEGGFGIVLSQNTYQGSTPSSCNAGRQFIVRTSHANYDTIARALMAAFLAGREVSIYWDSFDACRAHINRIQIR